MITLTKRDGKYCVYSNGQWIGLIELFFNPYHSTNCYVKIEFDSWNADISEELFHKIKDIAGRPLQVMVNSINVDVINFLTAGGFICKRKCYEMEVCFSDYIGNVVNLECCRCFPGDKDYEFCCRMMYDYYVNTHKAINPWTSDFATFCSKLPETVLYNKTEDSICSIAFIEDNEIAYVCGSDEEHFCRFAQSLISLMFSEHDKVVFECDDCDAFAIILKNMFKSQADSCFCTYVLE